MNRDDILRMAREAMKHTSIEPNDKVTFYVAYNNGVDADGFCDSVETFIERFAALVYAEAHKDGLDDFEAVVLPAAIKAEREACAYRAGIALLGADRGLAKRVDYAIRERGAP